jgi:hypothetical protein
MAGVYGKIIAVYLVGLHLQAITPLYMVHVQEVVAVMDKIGNILVQHHLQFIILIN